jgi:hypothetical protein
MKTDQGEEFVFPDEAEAKKAAAAPEAESEVSFEIEDDTPPEDRNRKPTEPPEEVTEDELSEYDEKVQKRIKKFTRGYHDERRAKEAALREREAAETLARQLYEENRTLQQRLASGSQEYIEQAKKVAESEMDAAKRKYREAYDAGDSEALVAAQEEMSRAALRADRVSQLKPLQVQEKEVQLPAQRVDSRAEEWKSRNQWFGKNRAMSAFALGLHAELVEERGINPNSDKYYQEIDKTMRKKFPEAFESDGSDEDESTSQNDSEPADEEQPQRRATKPASVVAPAARSTPPNRIRLKQSEVAIAKRLGIPLELYAKKVAELRNGA